MQKKIIVVGAGFGGLSAAALLAKEGFKVEVVEKMHYQEAGHRFLKLRDFNLIWDHHGI